MRLFFDTSAIVPLLLREPHSPDAREMWKQSEEAHAWRWIEIETEAALVRRRAPPLAWKNWNRLQSALNLLTFPESDWPELRAFNRGIGLRAADAAHLYVMEKLARIAPGIALASFDEEMLKAAEELQLDVFRG